MKSAATWETAERPTVTALVTCFNEEERIAGCIDSLLWCDRVVVVDSYSTDRTLEILAGYPKVELLQHEYLGGAAQKNWALGRIGGDWVLIFDSDEVCTPALTAEIQSILLGKPQASAYTIHREVYFLGRRIRFSGWQHDRVTRLFRRGTARYVDRRVHARLLTEGPAPMLEHSMEHHMVDRLDEYIRRTVKYSNWGAAQAYRDGLQPTWRHVFVRPVYRFLRTYVLQAGFRDGMRGLAFCMLQAAGAYLKYATLWGWRVNEARGLAPDLPEFDDGYRPAKPARDEPERDLIGSGTP